MYAGIGYADRNHGQAGGRHHFRNNGDAQKQPVFHLSILFENNEFEDHLQKTETNEFFPIISVRSK
jgi:hypothetical protein